MKRHRLLFAAAMAGGMMAAVPLAHAVDCQGAGNPSVWGSNMSGAFPIQAGTSCTYGFRIEGTIQNSKILQPARHGRVRMLDKSTFEYKAPANYRGLDTFKIQATGHGPTSRGTSDRAPSPES